MIDMFVKAIRSERTDEGAPLFEVDYSSMSASYDRESDVLYVRFEDSEATDVYEWDGVIVFLRERWFGLGRPILLGITVLNASESRKKGVSELISLLTEAEDS